MSSASNNTKTLLSWNVNGIRAAEKKGFVSWIAKSGADVVAVQETKVHDESILSDALLRPQGYNSLWSGHPEKKGYSGVAVYTKKKPLLARKDFGASPLSEEGRLLELEYEEFYFLNCYFPNGGLGPHRIEYKLAYYDAFLQHVRNLEKTKPVIFCGDINTAHNEIDLARPKENEKNTGFLPVERAWLDEVERAGFVDTFRSKYPTRADAYSYWDMETRARDRNVGWRIDYFFVSASLAHFVKGAFILDGVEGSDHCPVGIIIEI